MTLLDVYMTNVPPKVVDFYSMSLLRFHVSTPHYVSLRPVRLI